MGVNERWDCIYVDRINPDGRIYLTDPQQYGFMYSAEKGEMSETKVRKSIPTKCGQIIGLSNDKKILKATAIAAAFNRTKLKKSKGLVIRGFKGQTPSPGLQIALIKTEGKHLRVERSKEWLVYVSPDGKFFSITDSHKGEELLEEQSKMIHECVKHVEEGCK